jgi:hypothetical protein
MRWQTPLLFVLSIGCTASPEGEVSATSEDALSLPLPSPVQTLPPLDAAFLRAPAWAQVCGSRAPLPTRIVAQEHRGCRDVTASGGVWRSLPVASRHSSLCELTWRPYRPFTPPGRGRKATPAAPPDYAALSSFRGYHVTFGPYALCGTQSASDPAAFQSRAARRSGRTAPSSTTIGVSGCGACGFTSGRDLYAFIPHEWRNRTVHILLATEELEVEPLGQQLVYLQDVVPAGYEDVPVAIEQ